MAPGMTPFTPVERKPLEGDGTVVDRVAAIRRDSTSYADLAARMLAAASILHRQTRSRYGTAIAGRRASVVDVQFSEMYLRPLRDGETLPLLPNQGAQASTGMVAQGHLLVTYDRPQSLFYCADLSDIYPFIHTRFGGAYESRVGYVRHYAVSLYLDDFPGLATAYFQYQQLLTQKLETDDARQALAVCLCEADEAYAHARALVRETRSAQVLDSDALKFAEARVVELETVAFLKATDALPFDTQQLDMLALNLGIDAL